MGDHLDILIPASVFFPQEVMELLPKSCQGGTQVIWPHSTFLVLQEPGQISWSSNNDTGVRDFVKKHFLGSPKPVTAKPLPSTAGEGWLLLWGFAFPVIVGNIWVAVS